MSQAGSENHDSLWVAGMTFFGGWLAIGIRWIFGLSDRLKAAEASIIELKTDRLEDRKILGETHDTVIRIEERLKSR